LRRGAAEDPVISLLVPSRRRPEQLDRMWRSARGTADDPGDVELVVRLDDDDTSYDADSGLFAGSVIWAQGPRILMSNLWNDAYDYAHGDILMHAGDDVVFRTAHWDTRVHQEFARYPDGVALVHGRDGSVQDEVMAIHGFLTRRWVEALGYFVPPYFSSDYNDTWLTDVANALGRRVYMPDVLFEHMHPVWGKGSWDRTHIERIERDACDDNRRRYEDLRSARAEDVTKLRALMR
jgi:hypothetical protein